MYSSFEDGFSTTITTTNNPEDLLHAVLGPARQNPMQDMVPWGFSPFGPLEPYRNYGLTTSDFCPFSPYPNLGLMTSTIDGSAVPFVTDSRRSNAHSIFPYVRRDCVVYTDSLYE